MTFQTISFEIQCVVAIYTTYTLIIDDFANESHFKRNLKEFYICAKFHGLTPVELLQRLCGDTCETISVLRVLGKAHPQFLKALDAFVHGYVLYHLSQKRYRLDELEPQPRMKSNRKSRP